MELNEQQEEFKCFFVCFILVMEKEKTKFVYISKRSTNTNYSQFGDRINHHKTVATT